MDSEKFKVKSELDVFKLLQKNGRLSSRELARKTGTSPTAIKSVSKRMEARDFYQIRAVPRLEKFPEVPMAFIAFPDVHPVKLRQLKEQYSQRAEILGLVSNDKEVLLILADGDKDRQTELIFEIMGFLQCQPTLHIVKPSIEKFDITIPDKVLDKVYSDLPDRRRK